MLEIAHRIVLNATIERRTDRHDGARRKDQGVPVRLGSCDLTGGGRPASTCAILDNNRLAEALLQAECNEAGD